jgi:hypothetical protein
MHMRRRGGGNGSRRGPTAPGGLIVIGAGCWMKRLVASAHPRISPGSLSGAQCLIEPLGYNSQAGAPETACNHSWAIPHSLDP